MSVLERFVRGTTVRVSATFTDADDMAAEPTNVTCQVRTDQSTTVVDVTPVRDGVGAYHADIDTSSTAGTWYYRFAADEAAGEGKFLVWSEFQVSA